MNTYKTIQQGDVLLRRVTTMPKGEQKQITKGRCVLAHGESGHSHVIDMPETDAELIQIGERMLLDLKSPGTLVHEEHKAIELDAGVYEIGRVNEYDYLSEMARKVQD